MGAPCSRPKLVTEPEVRKINKIPGLNSQTNVDDHQNTVSETPTGENIHPVQITKTEGDSLIKDDAKAPLLSEKPNIANEKAEKKSPRKIDKSETKKNSKLENLEKKTPSKIDTLLEGNNSPTNPSKTKNKVQSSLTSQEETITKASLNDRSFTTDTSPRKTAFQYKKGPMIGKGSFAEVFECLNLNTGELLAVKSVKIHGDLAKMLSYIDSLKKEISVLKSLSHPNIVKYYTTDFTETKDQQNTIVDIVLEYVSGGSVKELIEKFGRLDERITAGYVRQILDGLCYLHFHGIVHRDVKGANVLLDASGRIKLTDFGCSKKIDKFVEDTAEQTSYIKGSPYWMAPEVVSRKTQGKPADIWSVGCVVIELLTGKPPWSDRASKSEEVFKLITAGTPPPFPKDISENCRDFLLKCLKFKADDRPSASDLINHPFLQTEEEMSYSEDNFNNSLIHSNLSNMFEKSNNQYLGMHIKNDNKQPSDVSMSNIKVMNSSQNSLTRSAVHNDYQQSLTRNGIPPDYQQSPFAKLRNPDIPSLEGSKDMTDLEKLYGFAGKSNYHDHSASRRGQPIDEESVNEESEEEEEDEEDNTRMMTNDSKLRFDPQEIPIVTPLSKKLKEDIEKKEKDIENERAEKKRKWEEELQKELAIKNAAKMKKAVV
jgi:serine/threonine protein kinase